MCAANFLAGYQMSLETSCPNNDISRLVALGIGIGAKRMTRNTRATSDCRINLEVYGKCVCVCVCVMGGIDFRGLRLHRSSRGARSRRAPELLVPSPRVSLSPFEFRPPK